MSEQTLDELLRDLTDEKRKKKRAAFQEQEATNRIKELEAEIIDRYPNRKAGTVSLGEGYGDIKFSQQSRNYVRIFNEDAARKALEEEGLADEALVPGFNRAALNDLIRERAENGQPLPDGIAYTPSEWVTITEPKKKS
jgi:hypothetical protein